jgi:serine/threonine protein kinase/tetratricopeptide (TPR) repeat protein
MTEPPLPEESIFAQALEITSAAERAAFLDRACGHDQALRAAVEALLRTEERSGDLLDLPENVPFTTDLPAREGSGTFIGPYKLLEPIGEGGMGTVWMAEQTDPIQRRVAVKVVKEGMDSRQVLARFEAERQALAVMEHPHIAKVLDAGKTSSGRPYFVMELVKGKPITNYCDEKCLGVQERLVLFGDVCRAVQHAHQKGIIHRDLKPSNVLVAPYDGKPVVKVIDFGVAKATGQRLTDKTLFTGFGALVGTPEYMSPEQAEINNQDVDTRSDIYSLGVLLYELLTGSTPLTRKRIKEAAILEVLRVIREEEPPRPSTRLSESKDSLPSISAQRQTEPAKLTKLVRGELDWIVMKALEKDRNRRYETANGFAADVERYLADEPVQACPPSAWYRFRKFARRNRAALATASVVAASLIAGVVGLATVAGVQVRANVALRKASAATEKALIETKEAKQATEVALGQSEELRRQAEAVSQFLVEAFRSPDPSQDGRQVKVADVLDRASARLDQEFAGSQATKGALLQALGLTFRGLGLYDRAVSLLTRALAVRESALRPDHPDTLKSRYDLAGAYQSAGRLPEAIALHEATLKLREAKLGHDHPDTLKSRNNLANNYYLAGRFSEAIALHEGTLKLREAKLGPDHDDTLTSRINLANAYSTAGRLSEAIALHEAVRNLMEARLGLDHPDTLNSRTNLAVAYQDSGRTSEAIALHEATLKRLEAKLGPDHPFTLHARNDLADAWKDAGRFSEAIALHQSTLKLREARLGPDHPDTLISRSALALAYQDAGRTSEAIALGEATVNLCEAKLGPDHIITLTSRTYLAAAYGQAGRSAEAEGLHRDVLARLRKTVTPDGPVLADQIARLGGFLLNQSRWSEAEPLLREDLAIYTKATPDDWKRYEAMSLLGGALLGQGRHAEAEPLLVQGYEGMKARGARITVPDRSLLREAAERVVRLYEGWSKAEQARAWKAKLGIPDLPAEVFATP